MRHLHFLGTAAVGLLLTACSQNACYDDNVVDQKYIHKYGVTVPSDYWTSSGEHGAVVSSMADGVVITRTYASGLLDGDTTYTFPHSGQVAKKEIYVRGSLTKEISYYFDGTPSSETLYDSPLGSRKVSCWYHNGTPKSVEEFSGGLLVSGAYYTASNQHDASVENYNGTRLVRDDYGQLLSTDLIEQGRMSARTVYHTNGTPKEIVPYCNDLVDGAKRCFNPAGEPETVEQWSQGMQHGTTVIYQHGEKYAEVPYQYGNRHGVEKRYRDGQVVMQEVSWENGLQHGPTTCYAGDSCKTDWYYRGEATTKNNYEFMTTRPVVR